MFFFSERMLNFRAMTALPSVNRTLAVSRLTALWALTEAGLGGVLHAFKTPFTGIFVGGIAVVLIVLIGHFSEKKAQTIIRSLLIVLMVKVAVSPHSPPAAYLAVSFQALVGALLYSYLTNPRIIGPVLGILALAESAGQKLLTLTILFGESFWNAIDTFVEYAQSQLGFEPVESGGAWIAWSYIILYVTVGAIIGWWAGRLTEKITSLLHKWKAPSIEPIEPTIEGESEPSFLKTWWKRGRYAILMLVLFLVAIWGIRDQEFLDPIILILRALCVLVLWYGIISPIIMELIKGYLSKRKAGSEAELAKVMNLLPHLRGVSKIAWEESNQKKGLSRLSEFMSRMIVYSISLELEQEPQSIE